METAKNKKTKAVAARQTEQDGGERRRISAGRGRGRVMERGRWERTVDGDVGEGSSDKDREESCCLCSYQAPQDQPNVKCKKKKMLLCCSEHFIAHCYEDVNDSGWFQGCSYEIKIQCWLKLLTLSMSTSNHDASHKLLGSWQVNILHNSTAPKNCYK